MKPQFLIPLLSLLILAGSFALPAHISAKNQTSDDVELIAIRMYADWCGYCKELDGKLDNVKSELKDDRIWFTYFDITDEFMQQQTKTMANKLNLGHIYEQYNGQTGLMVIVNPQNGEVIKEITSDISEEDLTSEILSLL